MQSKLFVNLLLAISLGVFCGLFFGELCASLNWIGKAYVGLLQMSVLPYVITSLISVVGRLPHEKGTRFLWGGLRVMLLLWGIGIVVLVSMSACFPTWESGSFFSANMIQEPPEFDWLALFIPSNPFRSMVESHVPAVVVFSVGLGTALIRLPNKDKLLDLLELVGEALSSLNRTVLALAPLGIFAIVANATGTLDFEQLALLQGYLIAYGAAGLLITLWILPLFAASVTPFSYRQLMRAIQAPLITAFMIGNTFVVLPMVIDAVRGLICPPDGTDRSEDTPHAGLAEFTVPIAYSFPDIGRVVGLLFLPFAAWFYGMAIAPDSYGPLLAVGLLGAFANHVITIPLMLQLAEIPSDIFNLYLSMGVVAGRFGDIQKTMHLFVFGIVTSCIISQRSVVNWRKVAVQLSTSVALCILTILAVRCYLDQAFTQSYSRENLIEDRESIVEPVPQVVNDGDGPVLASEQATGALASIRQRGTIRVGYDRDALPFSYFNSQGRLVGHDIDMAHTLARDLSVAIEFWPITSENVLQKVDDGQIDVAMAGLEGTIRRAQAVDLGHSYMDVTLSLVVRDHDKSSFSSLEKIRAMKQLRFAVVKDSYFNEFIANATREVDFDELESEAEFFSAPPERFDALLTSAEAGAAWTLRHPEYAVVNPMGRNVRVPLFYAAPSGSDLQGFMKSWLELKQKDGTLERLYDYWIFGKSVQTPAPRWCILRDVLHYID